MVDRLCELGVLKLADVDKETDPRGEGRDVFGVSKEEVDMAGMDTNVDVGAVLPPLNPFHHVQRGVAYKGATGICLYEGRGTSSCPPSRTRFVSQKTASLKFRPKKK